MSMQFRLVVESGEFYQELAKVKSDVKTVEKKAEVTRKMIITTMLQTISMVYGVIGKMLDDAGQAIGSVFTSIISAVSSLISLAYMSAATYALTPYGQALAALAMGNAMFMAGQQVVAIVQKVAALDDIDNSAKINEGIDF